MERLSTIRWTDNQGVNQEAQSLAIFHEHGKNYAVVPSAVGMYDTSPPYQVLELAWMTADMNLNITAFAQGYVHE